MWYRTLLLAGTAGVLTLAPAAVAAPQFVQEPVTATLFSDDFSDGLGNWTVGTNTLDHTQFGQAPTTVTGSTGGVSTYARFALDTYNAAGAGTTFAGTQLSTNQTFALPTSGGKTTGGGVQFQVSARVEPTGTSGNGATAVPTAAGLNAAAFAYGYSSSSNYLDEIDSENLTAQQAVPTASNPTGATSHTNTSFGTSNGDATLDTSYKTTANGSADNSYYAQHPYAVDDTGSTGNPNDLYTWHTYDIVWYPKQIDWYIDGTLVREESASETSTANPTAYIPNEPMAFYLNFWAPASTFADAYSSSLTPSPTAAANQAFYYDVADVSVSNVAAAGTPEPTMGLGLLALLGFQHRRRRQVISPSGSGSGPLSRPLGRG